MFEDIVQKYLDDKKRYYLLFFESFEQTVSSKSRTIKKKGRLNDQWLEMILIYTSSYTL